MVEPSNQPQKKSSRAARWLKLLLKIAITALCFWYISKKINFSQALAAVQTANWLYLSCSVLLYIFSKLVAALRLNIYFRNIGLLLPRKQNLKLYWLGMFYNLFLPGSISGDAYKVVLLNKRLKAPYKKTSAAVLLDRFSGLLGLGLILCIYAGRVLPQKEYVALLAGCSVLSIAIFYWVIKKFFSDFLPAFFSTLLLGTIVQAIQVGGVYLILLALHLTTHFNEWIFLFLFASVVSVLPLSLGGGLGTREVIFAEGSTFLGLNPHLGVIISLLFYLTSVAGAAWGVLYVFRDPLRT